jgi:hypothetical protein
MKTINIFCFIGIMIVTLWISGCASSEKIAKDRSRSILFVRDSMALDGKCRVMGRITNIEDHDPLSGASITVVSTILGAATDRNGNYRLPDLLPGTYNIEVGRVGYKTIIVPDLELAGNQRVIMDFELARTERK